MSDLTSIKERIEKGGGPKLTEEMLRVLRLMGTGLRVSIYIQPGSVKGRESAYWAKMDVTHDQPKPQTVYALRNRGLIESYDDAAGITEAGRSALITSLSQREPT